MKKYLAVVLALFFVLSPVSGYAAASFALTLSADEVQRGGAVTLSGTVASGVSDVAVKIVRPNQTVLYIDSLTPSNGAYTTTVAIPENEDLAPFGVYRVVAGIGTLTETKSFSVVEQLGGNPGEGGGTGNGNGNTAAAIPSNAGKAEGSIVKPELALDGRLIFGSETMAQAIQQATGFVTVELPTSASDSGRALEFPAKTLKSLKDKQLDLLLKADNRTVLFADGSIPAANEEQSRVQIVLHSGWTDEAKSMVNQSLQSNPDYTSTGIVLSVVINVIDGDNITEIHHLDKPAVVTMKLTEEQQKLISSNLAGVYYVNGDEPVYAPGTVNNGLYTFTAEHFSYYTILEYNKAFVDLANHWAETPVKSLAAKHIVKGVDDQHYMPNRSITRAEFVALVMRAIEWTGKPSINAADNPFSDVPANQYYTEQVAEAASLGIISGYNVAFRPNEKITREEAVVALVRADQYLSLAESDKGKPAFADAKEISGWAAAAVNEAWSQGLIQGDGTRFYPKNPVTRAEMAVMINRMLPNQSL